MSPATRVLALVRDLFFRSKLDAVAGQLGVEIIYASKLDSLSELLGESEPRLIMVDLNDANFPPDQTIAAIRSVMPELRVIGFASHVDLKALRGAREAGFTQVLSRSEFTAKLPELLRG